MGESAPATIRSQRARSDDAVTILVAKAARTFCYGFLGILLPVYLTELGVGARGIGFTMTLTLVASATLTWAVRRPAERLGAPTTLIALAALSVLAAALLLGWRQPWVVIVAAMLGNVAVGTGETGPFLALEQVVMSRAVAVDRLPLAMSLYNLVGYGSGAVGAMAAGRLGRPVLFAMFGGAALVQIAAYARLRPDAVAPVRRQRRLASLPSAPVIRRLAALFALDSLAGGFVLQSLIAYWFHRRHALPLETIGTIFFAAHVVTALSLLAAARLARRFGLVNTMVWTHLGSNVLLIAMAVTPSAPLAVALLLARQLFSQMDVPTRQAYVMSVVADHEREAASSVTNLARTVAQAATPVVTGYAMQFLALSAPFVLGGGLKIVYDLLLYATFRRVKPRES